MAYHKDITGQVFGFLEVIGMVKKGALYHAICKCRKCGTVKTFMPCNLRKGTRSCGCLPRARKPPLVDLVGQRFGFLVVVAMKQASKTPSGKWAYYAICRCLNCGNAGHPVLPAALRRGATTSCGCRRDQYLCNTGERNANFKGYKEIRSHFWKGYQRGAKDRGIPFNLTVEYAWSLYEAQRRRCALSGVPVHFGPSRSNTLTTASMDRLDPAKGYVRGNVQWVHKRVNLMRNTLSVSEFVEWCRKVAQYADRVPSR